MAATVVWRIARKHYALDRRGIGARDEGGRWNHPGTGVIYTGCTSAIAALEKFVHLAGVVPADLVLVRVLLPEGFSVEQPALKDLPRDWDSVPSGIGSMDFGTRWAQEDRSLVLYVPSALLREETNAVINPSHPEFAEVKMKIERRFTYDSRMYESRGAPAPKKKTRRAGWAQHHGSGPMHRPKNPRKSAISPNTRVSDCD